MMSLDMVSMTCIGVINLKGVYHHTRASKLIKNGVK